MTALEAVVTWRPRPPFFYGWLVLGVGALGAFVATSIAGAVLGGIQEFIIADTGWSRSALGLAAALGVWGSGLVAPVMGYWADRYGPRRLMALGTLGLGLGLYALGSLHTLGPFVLVAVLARALSQPVLIGVVPQTLAVRFFRRRRNRALALVGLFRPTSSAILLQLISLLAVAANWRLAFRALGCFSLLLTLLMLLIIRRCPEDLGLGPDGDPPTDPASPGRARRPPGADAREVGAAPRTGHAPQERAWTAREVLRTRTFWLVAASTFVSVTSSSALGFNLVPYLHDQVQLSRTQATAVLSVSPLCALTTLLWSAVADRWTPRWCLIGALLGGAGLVLVLTTVQTLSAAVSFGIVWGTVSSAQVLVSMMLAHDFGSASYGTLAGVLRPFEAGGLGLGQSLGAALYDLTGSYTGLLGVSLGAYLLAALLLGLARPPTARHRAAAEVPTAQEEPGCS
jgi:sugar phosphate permease